MLHSFLKKMKYALPTYVALPLTRLYNLLVSVVAKIRGCRNIDRLLPIRDDVIYVIALPHIGDMCYVLAFLDAFREFHKEKKIILLVTNENKRVLRFYIDTDHENVDMKILNVDSVYRMFAVYWLLKQHNLMKRNDIFCFYRPAGCYEICGNKIFNAVEMTKIVMFRLPENTKPSFPRYDKIQSQDFENFRKRGKKVIINPYSFSAVDLSVEFWNELVERLIRLGFTVYTNVCNEQKTIQDTQELRCSLNDLFSYVNEAEYFISRRSGIMDLIISCNCKFISICANDEWLKFYTLSAWGCNPFVYEQYGEPDVDKIMEYIEETKDL